MLHADDHHVGFDHHSRIAKRVRRILRRNHLMMLGSGGVLRNVVDEFLPCLELRLIAKDLAPRALFVWLLFTARRNDHVGYVKLTADARHRTLRPRKRGERRLGEVGADEPPRPGEAVWNGCFARRDEHGPVGRPNHALRCRAEDTLGHARAINRPLTTAPIRANDDQEARSLLPHLWNEPPRTPPHDEGLGFDPRRDAALLLFLKPGFESRFVARRMLTGLVGRLLEPRRLGPPGIGVVNHVDQVETRFKSFGGGHAEIHGAAAVFGQIGCAKNARSGHMGSIDQPIGGAHSRR